MSIVLNILKCERGVEMLALIEQEHKNVEQLLIVLRYQLTQLESEQQDISFVLMGDIVNFMRSYMDKYHHPKEDLIYSYYLNHYVSDVEMPNRLASEHQELEYLSRELSHTLAMIQLDSVIPFSALAKQLGRYIEKQYAHIRYESGVVFPLIVKQFTPDDWCHIEHLWKHDVKDCESVALFRDVYESLKERIQRSGIDYVD